MQSNVFSDTAAERFHAGRGDGNVDVVMTQKFANAELLGRIVFDDE